MQHGRLTPLRTVVYASALVLFCACNGSTETSQSPEVPEEADLEQTRMPGSPSFLDAPDVAFRGASGGIGAAQSGANSCVFGKPREITTDRARELGFDVDADIGVLERERSGEVLVSAGETSTTTVHLLAQVDHVWQTDRLPPAGVALEEAEPTGCPPLVVYELTVQLFTDDGALSGVFLARAGATPNGSEPAFNLHAESDLRNFSGSLSVTRIATPARFADAEIDWSMDENGDLVFAFQPRIQYPAAEGGCVEPLCPAVSSASVPVPLGSAIATRDLASLSGGTELAAASNLSTLSELVSALGPYRRNVRLWAVAFSNESSSVDIRVRVDGEETQRSSLPLVNDPRILTPDAVGGWLDLGELDESTPVEFEVEAVRGLSGVQSRIVVDGCELDAVTDRCTEPGCIARSAVSLSASPCSRSVH